MKHDVSFNFSQAYVTKKKNKETYKINLGSIKKARLLPFCQ